MKLPHQKAKNQIVTEYYQIDGGAAIPLSDGEDLLFKDGRVPPAGNEVLTLPGPNGTRRIVLYPKNSVTAIPVGAPIVTAPKTFSVHDFKNLIGPYLPHMLRRALRLEEDAKWGIKDWVFLGLFTLNLIATGVTAGLVIKGFRAAGLL